MGRAKSYRYQGGSNYSFNKYDKDFVLVDFETPTVPASSFIDFQPGDNFSQKGFEFESFIDGVDASDVPNALDEILFNKNSIGIIPSAIAALETFDITGKNGQENQGLCPNFFWSDLEVIYFEQDKWDEPAEREDFRFKGLYAAGYDFVGSAALPTVTLTFIGYRDGEKEFEFTKTVASGGFIKSNYRDKIDRLFITDNNNDTDFVIDNFMAEV